ncbi:MAG: alpha/beta hydrolase [Hyphomicrobiaceae bacterium]
MDGMIEILTAVGVLAVAAALYYAGWRSVGALPPLAKWPLRFVLALAILAPFILLVTLDADKSAGPPREMAERPSIGAPSTDLEKREYRREATEEAAPPPAPPPAPSLPAPVPSVPETSAGAAPDPVGGAGPRSADVPSAGSPPPSPAPAPVPVERSRGLTPPPPKPMAAPEPVPRAAESAVPDAAGSAAPGAAVGEVKEDWTIVPVFYGTDRARVPNDKRLDYGSERARRLELGRALVTVPKKHEVPKIERPWSLTIPYFNVKIYEQKEDPKVHFTMQELKALTEAEMLDLVRQRLASSTRFKDHAFVFVHGYNTTFDNAVYRTAQIAYDINFDGAPFLYSWPSGGGIASYTYDGEAVAQAEPYLKQFLQMVTEKTGAKSVSLIAHSMGNRLLLRVLQDLQRSKPDDVKISQIVLAAPDVDRDVFAGIAASLQGAAKGGITLYASANDKALGVSRRFNGGIPRAGDVPGGVPLVVPGVDTIDATSVSMDSLGLSHSGYAESKTLLDDIGSLIATGERPPEKRVPALKRIDSPEGPFWRYP